MRAIGSLEGGREGRVGNRKGGGEISTSINSSKDGLKDISGVTGERNNGQQPDRHCGCSQQDLR